MALALIKDTSLNLFQYVSRSLVKRFVDIVSRLCTGFKEEETLLFCKLFRLLGGNLSVSGCRF